MSYRTLRSYTGAARCSAVLFGLALGGCASVGAPMGERAEQLEIRRIDGSYNPCVVDAGPHVNAAFAIHSQCLAAYLRVPQTADFRFAGDEA